jgi:hypothetical protein
VSVLDRLANALGRTDERPNVELADTLAKSADKTAIEALVSALSDAPVPVQNDAIKVLYEIGARDPKLIAPHASAFFALLKSRNNRNVWGALQAIETIAGVASKAVAAELDAIIAAADKGSVIAKDKAMSILAQLAAAGYAARAVPILLDRLKGAAPNQFPMYVEIAAPAIGSAHRATFRAILEARLAAMPQPAKRKRIEKVLKILGG